MEHTDNFTYKLLLVAKDEDSAQTINHYFVTAGLIVMDVETSINNVIPKITRDQSYEGIILDAEAVSDVAFYVSKLRSNHHGSQVPIIVLAAELEWADVVRSYDAGANFVIVGPFNEDIANHVCWIFSSLVRFVSQFKENLSRFYRK